jgi:hypothetical protein
MVECIRAHVPQIGECRALLRSNGRVVVGTVTPLRGVVHTIASKLVEGPIMAKLRSHKPYDQAPTTHAGGSLRLLCSGSSRKHVFSVCLSFVARNALWPKSSFAPSSKSSTFRL